ncbi:MAG: colicin D domain-containing protein, partial [Flammeovirgaceae bacterium]
HINAAPIQINGTYRGTQSVTHYFDPNTNLWAAVDSNGEFVAGWKLYPSQVADLLGNGNVR